MTDTESLNPCLHCGGRAGFIPCPLGYQVECENAKCLAASGVWPTRPMAIRAWNRHDAGQSALETIGQLRMALAPLAILEVPKRPQGNAGAYSIRHDDIERAKELLNPSRRGAEIDAHVEAVSLTDKAGGQPANALNQEWRTGCETISERTTIERLKLAREWMNALTMGMKKGFGPREYDEAIAIIDDTIAKAESKTPV